MVDTHTPLVLASCKWIYPVYDIMVNWLNAIVTGGRQLVLDLLSVHLIRKRNGSVLISYHPNTKDTPITTAPYLHERIRFAGKWSTCRAPFSDVTQNWFPLLGQSVYWQSIFQNSPDPTFVLLTFIWHTIYAWDEALEVLYGYICAIVSSTFWILI